MYKPERFYYASANYGKEFYRTIPASMPSGEPGAVDVEIRQYRLVGHEPKLKVWVYQLIGVKTSEGRERMNDNRIVLDRAIHIMNELPQDYKDYMKARLWRQMGERVMEILSQPAALPYTITVSQETIGDEKEQDGVIEFKVTAVLIKAEQY